jgi:hypothetical protein
VTGGNRKHMNFCLCLAAVEWTPPSGSAHGPHIKAPWLELCVVPNYRAPWNSKCGLSACCLIGAILKRCYSFIHFIFSLTPGRASGPKLCSSTTHLRGKTAIPSYPKNGCKTSVYMDSFMNESVYCYGRLCLSACPSVCDACRSHPDGSSQEPDFVDTRTSLYLTSGGIVRISPMLT